VVVRSARVSDQRALASSLKTGRRLTPPAGRPWHAKRLPWTTRSRRIRKAFAPLSALQVRAHAAGDVRVRARALLTARGRNWREMVGQQATATNRGVQEKPGHSLRLESKPSDLEADEKGWNRSEAARMLSNHQALHWSTPWPEHHSLRSSHPRRQRTQVQKESGSSI